MSLRELKILDTDPEERYDDIVKLAAEVFKVPIAYIALIDGERQWFKSQQGLCERQTERKISFCGHAILQEEALVVNDAMEDPRFAGNPMVIGEPFVRFYAGQSVKGPRGHRVGTLCLVDRKPREFSAADRLVLEQMARLVEHQFSLFDMIEAQDDLLRVKEELLESKREVERLFGELSAEKDETDRLLHSILPAHIARELKERGEVKAERHDRACVLFADFTNFTALSDKLTPEEVVAELDACFCAFDEIMAEHGVEKLKTLGDGYMAASGIGARDDDGHGRLLRAALEIRDWIRDRCLEKNAAGKKYWDIRIGLHTGPIVAGVVGRSKFAYDIWGDTVNTASRLESNSEPGRINVSREFQLLVGELAGCVSRGGIPVKGKETIDMFFIDELK